MKLFRQKDLPLRALSLALLIPTLLAASQNKEIQLETTEPSNSLNMNSTPSAYWPQYVVTNDQITNATAFSSGIRGVLQRVEGKTLIVDFGRRGVHRIAPESTDFFENAERIRQGILTKDFPNLTHQIGNKLMYFGPDKTPKRIHIDSIKDTRYFLLIYLGKYDPACVSHLTDLNQYYTDELVESTPQTTMVILPEDRRYYDFGFTIDMTVPYMFPHMRHGYIQSLDHIEKSPALIVLTDAEGDIIWKSKEDLAWHELVPAVKTAIEKIR